jgi:hypothetical protein
LRAIDAAGAAKTVERRFAGLLRRIAPWFDGVRAAAALAENSGAAASLRAANLPGSVRRRQKAAALAANSDAGASLRPAWSRGTRGLVRRHGNADAGVRSKASFQKFAFRDAAAVIGPRRLFSADLRSGLGSIPCCACAHHIGGSAPPTTRRHTAGMRFGSLSEPLPYRSIVVASFLRTFQRRRPLGKSISAYHRTGDCQGCRNIFDQFHPDWKREPLPRSFDDAWSTAVALAENSGPGASVRTAAQQSPELSPATPFGASCRMIAFQIATVHNG